MKKLVIGIVVLALLVGGVVVILRRGDTSATASQAALASGPVKATNNPTAKGYVVPARRADLSFHMSGRVAQVLVAEGGQVKAGQPLVKLDDAELKAVLLQAQADLKRLQAGARPEELAAAQANLKVAEGQVAVASAYLRQVQGGQPQAAAQSTAQADLAQAQAQLKAVQDSYDSITSGRAECKEYGVPCGGLGLYEENARVQLAAAQAAYEAAQKRVAQARVGGSDDLRAAQARLGIAVGQRDAAQAQLYLLKAGATVEQVEAARARETLAQAALDEATLVAPFDGIIAMLSIKVGESAAPGVPLVSLADLSPWLIETDDLGEVDVVSVQPGAQVTITVDALPGVTLQGQVTSITPRSAVKLGDVTYAVKVALADPDSRLRWGMTAFVEVRAPASARPSIAPAAVARKANASSASAQGYIVPARRADLAFATGGHVAQVLAAEGDPVKAGQPLVKLHDADLNAALAQAQADLKGLQNGARPEEIAAAQANLDIANSQLEAAQADLGRLQNGGLAVQLAAIRADAARAEADLQVAQGSYDALVLGPGHGISTDSNDPNRGLGAYEENQRAQLAALRAARDAAQKRLAQVQVGAGTDLRAAQAAVEMAIGQRDAAQAQLDLLKAGATPEQVEIAQARVAQAQAALDAAVLVAPFDGTIAERAIHPGEMAAPGVRVVSLADLSGWEVETDDLGEVDVIHVQPGSEALVTVDALPGVMLQGQVTSIAPRSAVKRGDVTYTIRLAIADPDPRLRWGMTAYVDISK